MMRKVIIFPKEGRISDKTQTQEVTSIARWLESLDSLQQDSFKDDLEMFLNIVWLHQYLCLSGQGRVDLDEETLDRLSDFVDVTISYLAERLNIPTLLKRVEFQRCADAREGEIYESLCALLKPYLTRAAP